MRFMKLLLIHHNRGLLKIEKNPEKNPFTQALSIDRFVLIEKNRIIAAIFSHRFKRIKKR
jgi:hypothetical protein